MSFRLRITFMIVTIIAVLFSAGGAAMIHTTFQSSLNKEEQAALATNRMVLKMLQMVEEGEEWFDEKELVTALTNISIQDTADAVLLTCDKNTVFQRGTVVSEFLDQDDKVSDDKIFLSYFKTENREAYLQTTTKITLGDKAYYMNLGMDIHYVYEIRQAQIEAFHRILIILLFVSVLFFWMLTTFLTKPLQKLEESIKQLREVSDQKDRFMGAFTHELKTPMTSIIGYADLLRTQKLSKEEEEDALNYIFFEAKRLENMSLKMLDIFVADKNELDLKEASLKQLIYYVAQHLCPSFEKSGVIIRIEAEEGNCQLDPDLIQALLINLLDNGRKAMEKGGEIYVEAKLLEEGCQIKVKDQGKGIPKESLEHITEAFYRVDKSRAREEGNAGLGLALCDKIVKLHHGTMEFDSVEKEGTTVTVTLKGGASK